MFSNVLSLLTASISQCHSKLKQVNFVSTTFFLNGVDGQRLQYVFCCRVEHYSSYNSFTYFSTAIVEEYVKRTSKPRSAWMAMK